MATHVGLEMIKSKDNWQYSRATIFGFGGPFWHTGLHIGYQAIPNRLTTSGYLYNGWNSIYDNNSAKTVGGQVKWTPTDSVTTAYNVIHGAEQTTNNRRMKTVHEANIMWILGPKLAFASDILYGKEQGVMSASPNNTSAKWAGGTVQSKISPVSVWWFSPRLEYYRDYQGYTLGNGSQILKSFTFTNGLDCGDGLELRAEYRVDHSSLVNRFTSKYSSKASQSTVLLAMIYQF